MRSVQFTVHTHRLLARPQAFSNQTFKHKNQAIIIIHINYPPLSLASWARWLLLGKTEHVKITFPRVRITYDTLFRHGFNDLMRLACVVDTYRGAERAYIKYRTN